MIELQDITLKYLDTKGQITVLDVFNFSIQEHEFVSLVGPSGCGKTTIVNILAGYIAPAAGKVLIDKKIVTAPGKNRIVISQENDLFEWLTVFENIQLVAKDKSPHNVKRYIQIAHLENFEHAYPTQLSGGMKKRLSLVRALSADPAFIIMDEPFSSLDIAIKEKMHEEVLAIVKKSNKTVLLVTHDVEEAIFLSDRVVVLNGPPVAIKDELEVPFAHPRGQVLRDTPEFIALKNQINIRQKE